MESVVRGQYAGVSSWSLELESGGKMWKSSWWRPFRGWRYR